MEMNFENYINEKLGIREDVIILSDFLFNYLKDIKKESSIIIDGDILPKISFKVSKIFIKFAKDHGYIASLDERRTKLTKNGIEVYLMFRENEDILKSTINHELSHLIDHEIKLSKRINDFRDEISASKISNYLNNKKFENLCNMIYLSDEGEINSMTHEFHDLLIDGYNHFKNSKNKNEIFNISIKGSTIKVLYDKMINYNIFEDMKDLSDKEKIKFFNDLINWNNKMIKIKKNRNNKLMIIMKILYYIIHGYEKNIDLHSIMYKTQKHINLRGVKLRNNIHRLYGLL